MKDLFRHRPIKIISSLITLFSIAWLNISAQSLSVESFKLLETDLTANTNGTIEYDQNGEKAAIIKIITTATGFVFETGMLGIVKTIQKVSEIWVYVPRGIQKIKIMHPQLGQVEYYIQIPIESARTYELKLSSSNIRTIVELIEDTESSGIVNGHEYVDLGLSVKWATCNVGAMKPEEYGGYYAWGELITKKTFSWDNYRFCTKGTKSSDIVLSKYINSNTEIPKRKQKNGIIDNKSQLELIDDVAHCEWGGNWRMPSLAEYEELIHNCKWTWTTRKGVDGYLIYGKKDGYTDNYIFLPAAGYYVDNDIYYHNGLYWSNTAALGYSYNFTLLQSRALTIGSDKQSMNFVLRHFGCPIRPVCP